MVTGSLKSVKLLPYNKTGSEIRVSKYDAIKQISSRFKTNSDYQYCANVTNNSSVYTVDQRSTTSNPVVISLLTSQTGKTSKHMLRTGEPYKIKTNPKSNYDKSMQLRCNIGNFI